MGKKARRNEPQLDDIEVSSNARYERGTLRHREGMVGGTSDTEVVRGRGVSGDE